MNETPWNTKQPIPTDYETERMMLGIAMMDAEAAAYVAEEMEEEDFHYCPHQGVFRAVKSVYEEHGEVDYDLVRSWLHDRALLEDCGGKPYLQRMAVDFDDSMKYPHYARNLRDLRIRRHMMRTGEDVYLRAQQMHGSPVEQIGDSISRLESLLDKATGGAPVVGLDEIAEQLGKIEWTWEGWMPRGHITLVCAAPGAGKSAFALHLARCVATGGEWPDGVANAGEPQSVVYCDTESAHAFLLQRAEKWGVPIERIKTPGRDGTRRIVLAERESLMLVRQAIRKESAGLVVIDSLRGALTGDENSSEVSEVLGPWAEMAAKENVPLVLVHHNRKGSGASQSMSMDQVRGSSALVAIARSIIGLKTLAAGDAEQRRVRLEQLKSNFAPLEDPMIMTLDEDGCHFQLDSNTAMQELEVSDDFMARVKVFLTDFLSEGPQPAKMAVARCRADLGVARRTVYRARKQLGLNSIPDPDDGRERLWALPEPV